MVSLAHKQSPEPIVLSTLHNSGISGHSTIPRIALPVCRAILQLSTPEQVILAVEPMAYSHLPLLCPCDSEVRVQEEPKMGKAKQEKKEHHAEMEGQD
jgi:hypothetical protein